MIDLCQSEKVCKQQCQVSGVISECVLVGAQGVAFTIMHKSKGSFGAQYVSGSGFVVARAQKAKARRKTFMHWADDTFRCPPLPPVPEVETL